MRYKILVAPIKQILIAKPLFIPYFYVRLSLHSCLKFEKQSQNQRKKISWPNKFTQFFYLHFQPLQMRAVSSPSLTENPSEIQSSSSTSPKSSTKPPPNGHLPSNELSDRGHQQTGKYLTKLRGDFFIERFLMWWSWEKSNRRELNGGFF